MAKLQLNVRCSFAFYRRVDLARKVAQRIVNLHSLEIALKFVGFAIATQTQTQTSCRRAYCAMQTLSNGAAP